MACWPICLFNLDKISGWRCTLGCKPKPMALLMAFAIFLWLAGRRPVSSRCCMRPMGVMNSEIREKFYVS